MLSDEELIGLMVSEPSWEDVIIKIVAEEGMEPWNIDICKLADAFTIYLNRMEESDLRIPARFILIAAILLRMKSDILVSKKERLLPGAEKPLNPLLKTLAEIPPLNPPVKRISMSNVSVEELLSALRKAFEIKERRVERKIRVRRAVQRALPERQEDITVRISGLLEQIQRAIIEIEGTVKFSELVGKWEREGIVKKLIPMLHLTQEGKITHQQDELFTEIIVRLKKKQETPVGEKLKEETEKDEEEEEEEKASPQDAGQIAEMADTGNR